MNVYQEIYINLSLVNNEEVAVELFAESQRED